MGQDEMGYADLKNLSILPSLIEKEWGLLSFHVTKFENNICLIWNTNKGKKLRCTSKSKPLFENSPLY